MMQTPPPAKQRFPAAPQIRRVRARVLVVEDELSVREVLSEELREAGFTVLEASNAREALDLLHANTALDLVITDIAMPGPMDGVGLARRLKAEVPGLIVVLTSGLAPKCRIDEFSGGFFLKPYRIETLVSHLDSLMKTRKSGTAASLRRA